MHTRTTVLLAVALIIAGVWAWIDTPTAPPPIGASLDGDATGAAQAPGDGITRLLHFASPAIHRITLQRGAFTATLTRADGAWSGIADPEAVDDFLRSMQELAQIIVVGPNEGGPSDYGLDPPAARITLERAADDPIEVRIGNPNPTSTGVYAQVGATGPVVLTGALALWDLDKVVRLIQNAHTPAQATPPAKEAQP
jgi:hypothetical protein